MSLATKSASSSYFPEDKTNSTFLHLTYKGVATFLRGAGKDYLAVVGLLLYVRDWVSNF